MRIIWKSIKLFITLVIVCAMSIGALYLTCYLLGPPILQNNSDTVFLDHNKEIIEQANSSQEKIPLADISPVLIDAVTVVEDKDFYTHFGFDLKGIARATLKNIRSSSLKEGASTITQQLARNLYLSHEKTWTRKIKEAFYTIRLEMFFTKDEILESYLNTIYYGHGAYGIEAASNYFFDLPANKLTIAQAAMLAGVPKGPTYYSPLNDLDKATERQQLILKLLWQSKQITSAQYYEALSEKLQFIQEEVSEVSTTHFVETALKEASTLLNESIETMLQGGYIIQTTLDTDLQNKLHATISENITPENNIEIGALSIQPENGAVLALIGGNPYQNSSYNHVIDAKRMVGSTFKPLLYYAALENGFTPVTSLISEPTIFESTTSESYQPKNYNGYYANGPITLAEAIAVSDNIYAVKTNLFLTPQTVIETTRKFGISGDLPEVPSLALGTAAISVDEMVIAYGMIANGGSKINRYTVEKIMTQDKRVVYERQQKNATHILEQKKAFILTHLMTGMFDERLNGYTKVTGASIAPRLTKLYAGKSGTTNFDSWMIGFSPTIATGVWVGYDDNRVLTNVNDTIIAKQVWADYMELAHEDLERNDFSIPHDIVWKMIDPETGDLASSSCPISKLTYFEKGTEPVHLCSKHTPGGEEKPKTKQEKPSFFEKILQLFS